MDYWGRNMIKYLKSFKKRDDGVAAIEFALFAIPFFLLIMGIIEIGITIGAATVLNGATDDAARAVRTGQVYDPAYQPDDAGTCSGAEECFRRRLCFRLHGFIDCADLNYHVVTMDPADDFRVAFSNPSSVGLPPVVDPIDPTKLSVTSDFDAGNPNDRVIVRVTYDHQLLTPFAGPLLSDRPNNKKLIMSTAILQNEPYEDDKTTV